MKNSKKGSSCQKNLNKDHCRNRKKWPVFFIVLFLLAAVQFLMPASSAMAAKKVTSLEQLEKVFKKQISKGKQKITFTAPGNYTTAQLRDALTRAAKSQSRLLAGRISFSRQYSGQSSYADYTILLSADALMKIKELGSEKAAVKAAARALKNSRYSANFYSDDSYYEVFSRMLQEHPEYNYGTVVWKNTNGAYGYRRSSSLTKKQQNDKMEAADQAASRAVGNIIRPRMTDKQKARAIHDYIIKNCAYGSSPDAYTAYGALVDGTAVCQGYAAAFNLMAAKCGLKSMTVCGTTRGGAHAWNYVKIGNKYRYIDCTWDDTGGVGNGIVYVYFLVDADKMKEQHSWPEAEFPASDIKYYKYFK